MKLRLSVGFLAIASLSMGAAQIDVVGFAEVLRAKYGPSLARQVFAVSVGEMVVDYSASGGVCRIQLPPIGPDKRQPGVSNPRAVDEFATELVPVEMRGKQLQSWNQTSGLSSVSSTDYENVTFSESSVGDMRTSVSILFKNPECQKQAAP